MSRFKVGDLVTPISVKPYSDRIQRRLLGKTLVVYSFQDNGNSFLVFAGVIGDCGFFWHPDDLRLVSETQAEPEADPAPAPAAPDPTDPAPAAVAEVPEPADQPELTPFQIASKQFKPGDKVTPLSAERYVCNDIMKQLVGKTLLVRSVGNDKNGDEIVCAGVPGEEDWYWVADDLRLVSAWSAEPLQPEPTDPAPAAAQKPLRRGDLVEYQGEICVVFSKGADHEGDYRIASLTGNTDHNWVKIDELDWVGSIRKKVKRLKNEMEGGK